MKQPCTSHDRIYKSTHEKVTLNMAQSMYGTLILSMNRVPLNNSRQRISYIHTNHWQESAASFDAFATKMFYSAAVLILMQNHFFPQPWCIVLDNGGKGRHGIIPVQINDSDSREHVYSVLACNPIKTQNITCSILPKLNCELNKKKKTQWDFTLSTITD